MGKPMLFKPSCLFVLVLLFVCANAFAGSYMLNNGNFDTGSIHSGGSLTGWTIVSGTDFQQHADSGYYEGTYGLSIDGTVQIYQDFPAVEGDSFIVTGKVLNPSGAETFDASRVSAVRFEYRTASSLLQRITVATLTSSDAQDVWKNFRYEGAAPASTEVCRVYFLVSGGSTGKAYYDEFSAFQLNLSGNPDINNSGTIDIDDLLLLAADWGQPTVTRDLTNDGKVNNMDLAVMQASWQNVVPTGYQLVWADEFDGSTIDGTKWGWETFGGAATGNNELQQYTNNTTIGSGNSWVQNGELIIQAKVESASGYDYTSARMVTNGKASWTYGRMEARIKLPYGQGMWPAFWMMPTAWAASGWPACGEIDIMESVNDMSFSKASLHFGSSSPQNRQSLGTDGYTLNGGANFSDDYHIYSMDWNPGTFDFYVDDIYTGSMTSWWSTEGSFDAPFDKDFFFILNIAVGGTWPGSPDGSTEFPQKMYVDWVRVYQKPLDPIPSDVIPVPGRIEAEDFRRGGEGVAYHDTDTNNNGDSYRGEDVDIQPCSESFGTYNVGWTEAGEWMEYNIDVAETRNYTFTARVATPYAGRNFHIEIADADGSNSVNVTGTMTAIASDWQNWRNVTKTSIPLTAGEHVLKIQFDSASINVNYIDIQ